MLGSIASVLYRNDIAAPASRLPAGIRRAVEESIGSAVAAGAAGPAAAAVDAAQPAFTAAIQAVFLLAAALMAAGSLLALRMHRAHRAAVPLPPQVQREPTRQTTTRRPRGPACHAHDNPGRGENRSGHETQPR